MEELKITLHFKSRDITLSKEEFVSKFEEFLKGTEVEMMELTEEPETDREFEVNPESINRNLFVNEKADKKQEETRKFIVEALKEMDRHRRYKKPFFVMMPKKTWSRVKAVELDMMAKKLGDHMENWVELGMEFAQRISNGETWEDICDNRDMKSNYKLIKWNEDYMRIIGGSISSADNSPAVHIGSVDYSEEDYLYNAVPGVVYYK